MHTLTLNFRMHSTSGDGGTSLNLLRIIIMNKINFKMYGNLVSEKDATGEIARIYNELRETVGNIMPHLQLHATYAIEDMECFMNPMKLTRNHPDVPLIWFALMRLYIAKKENFPYCISLNKNMLYKFNISDKQIEEYTNNIDTAPLNFREILLLKKALKSIYDSHNFNKNDFDELRKEGYTDKTIYQIITYSTGFIGIAKRLNTYLVKEN